MSRTSAPLLAWSLLATALVLVGCPKFSSPPPPPTAGVDTTAPDFLSFAASPAFARRGVTVVLTFDANESLPPAARAPRANPEVTFGAAPMTCAATGLSYRCEAAVPPDATEGPVHFRVGGRDGSGNEREAFEPTPFVTLDFTAPTLTVTAQPNPATKGQPITFVVTSNEALDVAPTITAAFLSGTPACTGSGTDWVCSSATVLAGAATGSASFSASGRDRAGNTATSGQGTVDLREPVAGAPVVTIGSIAPNPAKEGDTVVVAFAADQNLATCAASIGAQSASCGTPTGVSCSCSIVVGPSTAEGRATVSVTATAGASGVASGTVEIDKTGPSVNGNLVAIARNAVGVDDSIAGVADALVDGGVSYPTRKVASVRLWLAASGGTPRATSSVRADGSFGPVTLAGTSTSSPPQLWASAIDAPGNEGPRAELLGGRATAVGADGSRLTIRRRPLGQRDAIDGTAGSATATCALKSIAIFDLLSAGSAIATAVPAANGSFPEVAIGGTSAAPGRVFVEATDKCGLVSPRTEALVGKDVTGPVGDGAKLVFKRRTFTDTDGLEGLAGAFADATSVLGAQARLFDAAAGGTLVGTATLQPDGSFAELRVGTLTASYARLWVEVSDKCGNVSPRAEALVNRSLGIVGDGARIAITRRPLTASDGVSGSAGAFSSTCAYKVGVYTVASGGTAAGTTPSVSDGSFAEVAIGTGTSSFKQAWAEAVDRCGSPAVRVEALVGKDVAAPVADLSKISIVRRDFTALDGLLGAPGAFSDATSAVASFRFSYDTVSVENPGGPVATDGSFAEYAVGSTTFAPARVWVSAVDKAGNGSARQELSLGSGSATPTVDGSKLTITRRGLTAQDDVSGAAGAIIDVCRAKAHAFDAASSGTNLGNVVVTASGSFLDLRVGTSTSSFKNVWIAAVDKCNRTSPRVQAAIGSDTTAPTIDASRLTFFSNAAGTPDELQAATGVVLDQAPGTGAALRIFRNVGDTSPATTVSLAADGSVARQAIGEIHHPPWVAAVDKAGNVSAKALAENLDWAQWPMPDSPTSVCTNGTVEAACPTSSGALYGQDGNTRINVPTYVATTDTVTDTATGLVWQRAQSSTERTWADAQAYCDGLVLAGAVDWRMPTYLELLSIVDLGRRFPAIDPVFQNTVDFSWSSSLYVVNAASAWGVEFAAGDSFRMTVSSSYPVRCVR